MKKTVILVALLASAPALATPAQVILIRHAEKSGSGLSTEGEERAVDLISYFADNVSDGTFAAEPAAIFAFQPQPNGKSERGVETVTPLATTLRMLIDVTYAKTDYAALAQDLLTNPVLNGKTILVCWEHKRLQDLAAALGVANPPKWDKSTYDHTWLIDFNGKGQVTSFRDLAQHLLPNDH